MYRFRRFAFFAIYGILGIIDTIIMFYKLLRWGDIPMLSIEEIKSYILPVVKKYPIEKVILYGSYARGDASTGSDIDLVVDSRGHLRNRKIFALGGDLLNVLPVRVDVYDILEIKNPSVMYDNIQKEGVVIYDSTR